MAGTGTHGEDQNQLVSTFCLGDALYGIDTMKVQEVVRVGDIIRVHHAKVLGSDDELIIGTTETFTHI